MTKITTSSLVYSLSDYQKEDKKPIISDVMFHTMLNNEKRKKYVCYILSHRSPVLDRSFWRQLHKKGRRLRAKSANWICSTIFSPFYKLRHLSPCSSPGINDTMNGV